MGAYKSGSCHCGAVKLRIPWDGEFRKARRCDCSYCARRSTTVASIKVEELEVLAGQDKLSLYTFNTGVAQHHFCAVCGIHTHHRRRSDPTEYGVNVAIFEGVDIRDYADPGFADGRNHPTDRANAGN